MRTMPIQRTFLLLAVIAAVAGVRCTMEVTGGGSEAGNARVVGVITDEQGLAAPNVIVRLLPSDFNPAADTPPGDSSIDTTDESGTYRIPVPENGSYSLQAVQEESRLRCFIAAVTLFGETDDTLPACALKPPGTVRVLLPESLTVDSGYLYIPGTTVYARVASPGAYAVLDSVPAGVAFSVAWSSTLSSGSVAFGTDVEVVSGETVTVPWPGWRFSRKIVLNTTASGADVQDDVTGFPVLVRLSAALFDFSEAKGAGEDIRFTTADGSLLPHEIESWDSTGGSAAVWVMVDTIRGNDSIQTLMMYWGNPNAVNVSNSGGVFDTAAGFQGVWHLGDAAADAAGDATVNGYHGIAPEGEQPGVVPGVSGNCREFDGTADYITMPNTADSRLDFPEEGQYTVSAWIKLDTLDGEPHLIVAKGFTQYFMRFTYFPSDSATWEFSEFSEAGRWQACTTPAASGQWALLVGVREGSRQLLYCNGILVDSVPNIYPNSDFSRDQSNDLSIGKFLIAVDVQGVVDSSYCFFKGSIDEVRIASSARSSGWVRLCYMNQRPDDRLVIFK